MHTYIYMYIVYIVYSVNSEPIADFCVAVRNFRRLVVSGTRKKYTKKFMEISERL